MISECGIYVSFSTLANHGSHSYHEHCITFIATKTDDVASSEITRALRLDKTPRYKEIESRLEALQTELEEIAERERTLAQQVKGEL